MHPRRPLFTLIGCSLLLTACTPVEPTPTPTPEPTYQCTPIFGGDPTTCTQQDHDALQATLAQYAEAEQIYRDSLAESWKLAAEKKLPSEALKATATGDYLDALVTFLRDNQSSDLMISGQPEVTWTQPVDLSEAGSDLAIRACVGPGTTHLEAQGVVGEDDWTLDTVFFTRTDKGLSISGVATGVVESC